MCAHYESVANPKRLAEAFGVALPQGVKADVWPSYRSIFIRRPKEAEAGDDAVPEREALSGAFGMIAHWATDEKGARKTYNARTETVAEKPTFRDAWRLGRHCIIPAEAIYEPDWRSGKAVPTRICRADGRPMGIAGIWTGNSKIGPDIVRSFTMLTVNAADHPLMRNFHKPEDEKRMVVILPEAQYDEWLRAPTEESMGFMRQYPAERLVFSAQG
jgi:putative SOS response-associated peptidase YedK